MVLRIVIVLFALVAAGGAAFLSMKAGGGPDLGVVAQNDPESKEPVIPMSSILVAAAPINSGEILSPEKLRWQPIPEVQVMDYHITQEEQPDAITELSRSSFVDTPLVTGAPIRAEDLLETNANLLSNRIAPGKRAVAVKVTAENTAGGFILPGDRVDVVQTITTPEEPGQPARNVSQIIISNARVLAIDQTAVQAAEGSAVGKTATLELTPAETERVVAAEVSGLLSLALRAVTDHGPEVEEIEIKEIRTVRIHRGTETSTITLR